MTLILESNSPEETMKYGEILGRMAQPGDVFCLNGELGAGKSVFARGVAAGLGITGRVASPTFTLINEHQGRLPFYHMDVYRLGSPEEMYDLGYEEYFYGSGITLVEWAGLVDDVLPADRLDINISGAGEGGRLLELIPRGNRYRRLAEELMRYVRAGN